MNKKLILLLLLIGNTALAQPGTDWMLKENSDGIRIYTRSVENSKFKAIKVECTLNCTLTQLVFALMDIKGSTRWLYHTSSNYLVKQVSPGDLYYYSMIEAPWPVTNRDFVAHLIISQNAATRVVTLDASCNDPDLVPRKPGVVRITYSIGKWILIPLSADHKVKIVYTVHADPGGSIPAWLSNMVVTEGPLQSVKKLRECLQLPAYKNAKVTYIKE